MAKNFEAHEPCVCCKKEGDGMVTFHHLFTRKVYPEFTQEPWNMIPVCQKCHNEFHSKGTPFMSEKYPSVKDWLLKNDWFFCEFVRKYRREGF